MIGKPRIAVTMGDPAGVGPELCVRALNEPEVIARCVPVVFGDASILGRAAAMTGQRFDAAIIPLSAWADHYQRVDRPTVVDADVTGGTDIEPGRVSARTGQASFTYIEAAIRAAQARQVAAVSTAPIHKKALHQAGIAFPGHTEIFADRVKAKRWCMMQYSEAITCAFVTVHCGYSEVPGLLTSERVLDVIELSAEGLQKIRGASPRIAVCGLNPHAGEQSLFGQGEEERIIGPAIEVARAKGLQVEGPLPPDTAFLPWKRECTDVFVCMYHDQGHIPVKALAFDTAVNTTLGLPIVRTSVDHGTALDIAWQGKANPRSLICAIHLAVKLASSHDAAKATGPNEP